MQNGLYTSFWQGHEPPAVGYPPPAVGQMASPPGSDFACLPPIEQRAPGDCRRLVALGGSGTRHSAIGVRSS